MPVNNRGLKDSKCRRLHQSFFFVVYGLVQQWILFYSRSFCIKENILGKNSVYRKILQEFYQITQSLQ